MRSSNLYLSWKFSTQSYPKPRFARKLYSQFAASEYIKKIRVLLRRSSEKVFAYNRAITYTRAYKRDEKKKKSAHQRDSIPQLFLMHLDDIVPNAAADGAQGNTQPVGCSSIICNHPGQVCM